MARGAFFHSYVECALWSSTDNADDTGGEPLDKNYDASDIDAASLREMEKDCDNFLEMAEAEGWSVDNKKGGFNFWLTRNGHGAGFWDGDYPEAEGRALTKISKSFGSSDLYIGDNNKLYVS